MHIESWTQKHFEGSLLEVFKHCCPVAELETLYTNILRPALGQPRLPNAPRKEQMLQAFNEALRSDTDAKRFFEAFSPDVQAVLGLLTWDGDLLLPELESAVGFPISIEEVSERDSYYHQKQTQVSCLPAFALVAFDKGDSWSYTKVPPKDRITVRLAHALRARFRKFVPPPKGYFLQPVEKLPQGLLTYRCDENVQEDLRLVADYINRGHLQRLASGKIKKTCIRALCEMVQGGEFFSGTNLSQKLELLRIDLFVSLLAASEKKFRSAMLCEPPEPSTTFRDFLEETFKNAAFFQHHLLSHLKESFSGQDYDEKTPQHLWALFSKIGSAGWITADALFKYAYYREIPLPFFSSSYYNVTVDQKGDYAYEGGRRKVDLTDSNRQDFLTTPLLQGTAFLLAALGFAEIAYTPPTHPRWQRGGEPFLTPWDGLVAVRLTPLGAYAFKQTDNVELKSAPRKRAEVFLNPNRLTVTSRNIDPVTELSLLEFMEKLSDGCFRMTRKSFLHGCITDAQVQARIEQFKSNISATPPAAWQTFLDDLSQGVVALKCKNSFKVYDLTNTPGLRQLFSTDPLLKEKTLKVEGLKVAISKPDLPLVTRRLADLGYLVQ
jgi:hypothetical protein